MGGTHLPQALLGHGAEAQDLPDDGHALQDVFGRCRRRGVSGDTCVCVCVCTRMCVCAQPRVPAPLPCPQFPPNSQVSRGSRAAICSGLPELERSCTSVSMFSLTSFCGGHEARGTGDTASPQPARSDPGVPAPLPMLATPRDRQGTGMVRGVALPALSHHAPELGPSTPTLVAAPRCQPRSPPPRSQSPSPTFSSVTWEPTCHMRLSLRNFIPYGPMSSASARISAGRGTRTGTSAGSGGDDPPPQCPPVPHLRRRRTRRR